jgi:hypothetical protein
MKTRKFDCRILAGIALAAASALSRIAGAQSTVVVTPTNMNGWAFDSFDNNFNPVSSGPYAGTAQIVDGPYLPNSPPSGTGSAELATNLGYGDGGESVATNNFNGTPLSAISSLSYGAYMASNGPTNNQQFPYLVLAISTDGNPITATSNNLDFVEFEPPYQQGSSDGNGSLPNQGPTVLGLWQVWNAQEGGWYDGNIGGTGGTNVQPLSAFTTAYPSAVLADPSAQFPGFDGLNLQVGLAEPDSYFQGYVTDVTFGTVLGSTTYDFQTSVPEPASFSLIGVGAALLMRRRRRA